MRSSHSPDQIAVTFDHDHAVADAGLILAASLAEGLMLRELLADRFQLQFERGTPLAMTFRLVVVDVISRLKPVTRRNARVSINMDRDDYGGYVWQARNATMGDLAAALSRHLRTPVADDTRLTGMFDVRFSYTQDVKSETADPKFGRTIFTALQEQVGLKLVAEKAAVPGYIIRRVAQPVTGP